MVSLPLFLLNKREKMKVAMTLAVMAKYVLMTALVWALPAASTPLKLGQNSHRKSVPAEQQQQASLEAWYMCAGRQMSLANKHSHSESGATT